jgi:hypothetical protein
MLWHQNEEIVGCSPFSKIYFFLRKTWKTFSTMNALPPTVPRLQDGILLPEETLPQPQLNEVREDEVHPRVAAVGSGMREVA